MPKKKKYIDTFANRWFQKMEDVYYARCSLRKKCPYSELFWSVFSGIRTEYGEIRSMLENTVQNNFEYEHFSRSGCYYYKIFDIDNMDESDLTSHMNGKKHCEWKPPSATTNHSLCGLFHYCFI